MDELAQSTERLGRSEVCGAGAVELAYMEQKMRQGEELQHLKNLLSKATYRGRRQVLRVTDG